LTIGKKRTSGTDRHPITPKKGKTEMKTKKIVSLLLTIVMMLGLSSVFVTAEDSPAYYDSVEHVTEWSFSDTIDGKVDESTWGNPNATFTRNNHFYPIRSLTGLT
jgi:hypothetical protein